MGENISSKIIYETPLNERIRTLLRVEHLMNQFYFFKDNEDQWGIRCSTNTLLEILELFSRKNIKNELLKELERQLRHLKSISKVSEINNDKLNSIIELHNEHLEKINALENKLKTHLRNHDLLNSIKLRDALPGGQSNFDIPAYNSWLNNPRVNQTGMIGEWFKPFIPVKEATNDILILIRESSDFENKEAENGYYEQKLTSDYVYQMIRIRLPNAKKVFPEISASRQKFFINFCSYEILEKKSKQIKETIDFELSVGTF
jgi:cell division protein ZapD